MEPRYAFTRTSNWSDLTFHSKCNVKIIAMQWVCDCQHRHSKWNGLEIVIANDCTTEFAVSRPMVRTERVKWKSGPTEFWEPGSGARDLSVRRVTAEVTTECKAAA